MALVEIHIDDEQLLPLDVWLVLVKARAGFKCERCEGTNRLAGHHCDEDQANNRLSNGEALCGSCHSVHHYGGDNSDKLHSQLTSEQRSERSRRSNEAQTPEERSARNRKGHETWKKRRRYLKPGEPVFDRTIETEVLV